ncbi:hypothetical protein [Subtercola boreus]|uniref:hypothetical protein n=1 Tax=Subtercola boreus TaxID=120213 RepID=UPI0011C02992|nr:hypothetical protein [Subtercola boreus]
MRTIIEAQAERRHNYERARAFDAPILRSLHPDALLVGYSIRGEDRAPHGNRDRAVEANHVSVASLESPDPLAFTTRTWKFGNHLDLDFYLHALDYLHVGSSSTSDGSSPKLARDELLHLLEEADQHAVEISVDGERWRGKVVRLQGAEFVRISEPRQAAMITIAAPAEFIAADYSSQVPVLEDK